MSGSLDEFGSYIDHLDMPGATCEQVHPVVEAFVGSVNPDDPKWPGTLSDWMEQANSCLTTEILATLGDLPTDPDESEDYLWSVVRLSWLFYRKYHDGKPFDT